MSHRLYGSSYWIKMGWGVFILTSLAIFCVLSLLEQNGDAAKNANGFYGFRSAEGDVLEDPMYPNEDSMLGVALVKYECTLPGSSMIKNYSHHVMVLREENLTKGDSVAVEAFNRRKFSDLEFIAVARKK